MFASHRFTEFARHCAHRGFPRACRRCTAGIAGAVSSTDDAFLTEITGEGISYDTPKAVISNAHYVSAPSMTAPTPWTSARRSSTTRT
jgi:hypothetical protein